MNPLSSELPFHVHNWLIISLKDFCIVIRKWPTYWPSTDCHCLHNSDKSQALSLNACNTTFLN